MNTYNTLLGRNISLWPAVEKIKSKYWLLWQYYTHMCMHRFSRKYICSFIYESRYINYVIEIYNSWRIKLDIKNKCNYLLISDKKLLSDDNASDVRVLRASKCKMELQTLAKSWESWFVCLKEKSPSNNLKPKNFIYLL